MLRGTGRLRLSTDTPSFASGQAKGECRFRVFPRCPVPDTRTIQIVAWDKDMQSDQLTGPEEPQALADRLEELLEGFRSRVAEINQRLEALAGEMDQAAPESDTKVS